jgi:hypothetical protein
MGSKDLLLLLIAKTKPQPSNPVRFFGVTSSYPFEGLSSSF